MNSRPQLLPPTQLRVARDRNDAFDKIVPTARNAKQMGNLGQGDAETGAGLESKQNCFADKVN